MQEQSLFIAALEKDDPADRAAFLDQACADDPGQRQRIDRLLARHEQGNSFLESPAVARIDTTAAPIFTERLGSVIGPYKLKEQIGEGGMGLVFVAEQHEPVRRKVALKLIKPGMDTRQVIARFEAERQALALMNHANIAKVFDGGETPSGRPYFVMELVKGVPITEYCDQNRLTPRARLELFGQVCAAVQHAHQKGIIHRDLKPSNVIVSSHDGTPVVKVIDFGVAKAIGQQLTDKSVYTNYSQFIGTPLYMSPEQAGQSDLDIDTRTDIYALGVLLYELLTGTTPFDKERLSHASYDEIRRLIREEEPPKPSTRLSTVGQAGSTISAQRQTNPQQLCLLLRGELDWIVMKSLEKDRNRRYESASSLAADVERYLKDEPVQACPPSRRYLLGKFLRRHRTGVLTTAALILVAILFAAGAGWVTLDRATRQVEADRQRVAIEQAVAEDLQEADKHQQQEQWANVRQALERAKGRLAGSGLDALQAEVEQRRRELNVIAQLEEARMKALALSADFNRNKQFAASARAYATAFAELDLDVMAFPAEDAARRIRASTIRSQLVTALDHWAYVKGRLPNADVEQLRAVAQLADDNAWRQQLRDPKVATDRKALEHLAEEDSILDQPPASLLMLSTLLKAERAQAAALLLLRRAQQRFPADFRINFDLGTLLSDEKKTAAEAVGFFRVALAFQPQSPHVHIYLANALGTQGLEHESQAQAACRKAIYLKPNFPEAYFYLGNGLWKQGNLLEAEEAFRKAIELEPDNERARLTLIGVLRAQQKFDAAKKEFTLHELRLKESRAKPGLDNFETPGSICALAIAYLNANRQQEAEAGFRKVIDLDPNDYLAHVCLAMSLFNQRKYSEAEEKFRIAVRLKPDSGEAYSRLGDCLAGQKKYLETVELFRKATRLRISDLNFYSGACAAALIGCGQGKDGAALDAQSRHRFREQALDWLNSELTVERDKLAKGARRAVRETMRHWKNDRDFDSVRGDDALANLPAAERGEWQKLWADVDELERFAAEDK
jgi:serine/threonine protein kinase/tetratricopeptide (TPR) repeat protein